MVVCLQWHFPKLYINILILGCKQRFSWYSRAIPIYSAGIRSISCEPKGCSVKNQSNFSTVEGQCNQDKEGSNSQSLIQKQSDTDQKSIPKSKLFAFLTFIKPEKLSEEEKLIHVEHVEALKKDQDVYKDPATGYDVITRLGHLRRGECCGNACRHCPYGQKGVPAGQPKKKFNTAFYH